MAIHPLFLAFSLAAFEPHSDGGGRYVPTTGWQDNEWAAEFYEEWYGGQLRAMNEPPLSSTPRLNDIRRFRLLVVPTYAPAFAYRVDQGSNGTASFRWVGLDGAGGHKPGNIAKESRRVLRQRELRRFAAALEESRLGSLPRELPLEPTVSNPDGTETITICLHATYYVFEHSDGERRDFITRNECEVEESLQRLIRAVFSLRPPESLSRR